ncbi:SusC/RagA family TonB-linked outer membrane protein [Parapedobacter tibetensis]|uniref:SusC/RagA family TonB-linked outer membrane protein n=1 Tax=Parapedobacter tibetensis TaxID=2972951 RepID=UPI00214DA410|nr:SusC/RagA family TonB-linked outer membrane protein [Parapedobacter tibetensis]
MIKNLEECGLTKDTLNVLELPNLLPDVSPINGARVGNLTIVKKWLMRIYTLFSLLTIVMISAFAAETTAQRVTLEKRTMAFEDVITSFSEQTGFNFIMKGDLMQAQPAIELELKNVLLDEALEELFSGRPFTFEIKDELKLVVVKEKTIPERIGGSFGNGGKDGNDVQQKTITGVVTDTLGTPVESVTIRLKGSPLATYTNQLGEFTLQAVPTNGILEVQRIGYEPQEISINGRQRLVIELRASLSQLDEVVVIGYGTQVAEEVTGAVSTVNAADFNQGAFTDAAELVQGKVAGLNITTPDADPLSTSQINLRGVITLASGSQPLILIDGVPGDLDEVSPEEIESINVLKDGSAAAIYGTRGSNGVILLTTKSVKRDIKPTISIKSSLNVQAIARKLDFLNTDEYREKVQEGLPGAIDQGASTNWLKEVTRSPISQIHDISLQGGNRASNYIASLRYSSQNGIMKKSNDKKIYPRFEVNHSMFDDMLKITANINAYTQESFAGSPGGGYNQAVYYNALIYNPTAPLTNENGSWFQNLGRHAYDNPVALLEETRGINQNNKLKYYGTATFNPTQDLSLRILGSRDVTKEMLGYYETKAHTSTLRDGRNGFASRRNIRTQEDLFEATLEYDKTFFEDHNIAALIGHTWFTQNYQDAGLQNWDFPTDEYDYNLIQTGLALTRGEAIQSSYQSENKLISYFFRINYNFMGKYLLAASIRREGSSKFGINNKWASFPAISAGWNLHKEPFLSSSTILNQLKLRVGFGLTGTIPEDPYPSLSTLNYNTRSYIDGNWIQTIEPTTNPNPNLRWETKEEINLGIDFGLFGQRIWGSVDLYQRTTRDMIWDYSVPVPPYLFNSITANAATMKNKGLEITLNASVIERSDFQWNTAVNYATNTNEVISLTNDNFQLASGYLDVGATGEPILQTTHRIQIGEPIGNFFGYHSVGVDEEGHWLIAGENGETKPISEQTGDDKRVLGNGLPDYYLNWNNTLTYKNLDLSIQMRGAFGFQILNMARMFYETPTMLTRGNVLNSTFDPVYGQQLALDQELQYISHYVERGDYWKISNVSLGYNMDLKHSAFFKVLRFSATGINLATLTGYSGIDPEVNSVGLDLGIDHRYRYPSARTYILGLSLTF